MQHIQLVVSFCLLVFTSRIQSVKLIINESSEFISSKQYEVSVNDLVSKRLKSTNSIILIYKNL